MLTSNTTCASSTSMPKPIKAAKLKSPGPHIFSNIPRKFREGEML